MSNIKLNDSEKQVAFLILEGKDTGEIADFLGVTYKHVDNMTRRLRNLMGCKKPQDAARKAKDQGLLRGL